MTSVLQLYVNRHLSVQNSLNNWFGNGDECINRPPSRFIWISVTSGSYLYVTRVVSDCMIDRQTKWLTLKPFVATS
jgi:hypothetical protein